MTVYTAIFGNYDDLKEPFVITPGWKYICFTDQNLKSDTWEIRKVGLMDCGPQKTARYYKIMYHKFIDDSKSIWVDGTFYINCDLNEWWARFEYPFTTIRHPFDNCVYTEIQSCIKGNKADLSVLKNQHDCYKKLGVPKNNGLIASGILMRVLTPDVINFCKAWWKQVEQFSGRDQIGFAYVNHKMPYSHNSIDWNYTVEHEFLHVPHLDKKWRYGRINEIKKYARN